MLNPDKYLSVKWRMGGRTFPVLDCFGLINEVRRDLNFPEWPEFSGVIKSGDGSDMDREARKMMLNLERCEPCEGAGAACYSGSVVTHVGIVVWLDNQLLVAECNPRTNVTFLPLNRFVSRFYRVEFWR